MIKDITLGQYYQTSSPIHKLDPRIKIVLLIVLLVFIYCASNIFSVIFVALFFGFIIILSKVPISLYFKNLKVILPILLFTTLVNVFYNAEGVKLVDFWIIHITSGGIAKALLLALRIVMLILISSTLTYTTSPNDLTDGIERLLSPLKYVGLANGIHTLSMMLTIALRFIPTLIEETEKIMNAQKARGADFETGKLSDRIKALIPILIPLLLSSFRRSYELADAMECRCYNGGKGKQRMKQLNLTKSDYITLVIVAVFCAGVILLNIIFRG